MIKMAIRTYYDDAADEYVIRDSGSGTILVRFTDAPGATVPTQYFHNGDYGLRDNGGTMQVKDNSGVWKEIADIEDVFIYTNYVVNLDTNTLYEPTNTGVQNALDAANARETILLPPTRAGNNPIEIDTTLQRKINCNLVGHGIRSTLLKGTSTLGTDPVLEEINSTACRKIRQLRIGKSDTGPGSGPTHKITDRISRLRAEFYDTDYLQVNTSMPTVHFTRCEVGKFEQAVEGVGLEAVQSQFGNWTSFNNVLTLRDANENIYGHRIIGCRFKKSKEHQVFLKGINSSKAILANNLFRGINYTSSTDTYDAIVIQDDASGDPSTDIIIRDNILRSSDEHVNYRYGVRLEGGTDYVNILGNKATNGLGTALLYRSGSQNQHGKLLNNRPTLRTIREDETSALTVQVANFSGGTPSNVEQGMIWVDTSV